ncbi:sodium-dependent neutral amino acid transporter SLC6A17-like [Talpa occidentalis]|uniref:sodium-dependent neutral amino acid transporter SLC6A17-like n=1 Tax=Talpa occidentalis TaxID=50954 RepID=UPI0023F67318|nr:sodium-dependent neutral amino acid transporter SLC6A17-like [Talpa occidentalis]
MDSLENLTEEEEPRAAQTLKRSTCGPTAKEVLASKAQNYLVKIKRRDSALTHAAFSVGLGSLWRFPQLCYRNGTGNFILIYVCMVLLLGVPLLYMEMLVGHWLRVDSIRIWKQLAPWLGGIGYASLLACIVVTLYNSVIIAWSLSYLVSSFNHPLPWDHCPEIMKTFNSSDLSCLQTVPHQHFWYTTILRASGRMEESAGVLVPSLSLSLLVAWLLLLLILVSGFKISTSMLFFSICFPCVFLFCFFIHGLFLEGAGAGLSHLTTLEFSAWKSLDLWRQAGGHVLYSLGLGLGTVINLSSCEAGVSSRVQEAVLVALVSLITSLLATCIILTTLSFWATTSGPNCVKKSVRQLLALVRSGMLPPGATPPAHIQLQHPLDYLDWIRSLPHNLQRQIIVRSPPCSVKQLREKFMEGPGLALVAFSQAISMFPGAPFWAILFFLTLVTLGLNTLVAILEGVVRPLQSAFASCRQHPRLLSVVVCLGGFLGSLVFASRAGSYIVAMLDDLLAPLALAAVVALQNVTLAWVYRASRFRHEQFGELGSQLWPQLQCFWRFVTLPGALALLAACLLALSGKDAPRYAAWNSTAGREGPLPYPEPALGWAAVLGFLAVLPVPARALGRWWRLQDREAAEGPEQPPSRKMPRAPPRPPQWPKHPVAQAGVRAPRSSRKRAGSSPGPGRGQARAPPQDAPWRTSLSSSWPSQSSWSSLPFPASPTSLLSLRSFSLSSRGASPARPPASPQGSPPRGSAGSPGAPSTAPPPRAASAPALEWE